MSTVATQLRIYLYLLSDKTMPGIETGQETNRHRANKNRVGIELNSIRLSTQSKSPRTNRNGYSTLPS